MKMSDAVEQARIKGLGGIIFTDHMDIDTPTDDDTFIFDPIEQQSAIDNIREKAGIDILKGIEIGLQPHALTKVSPYLKGATFDQIIASIHFVDKVDPYHQREYYEGKDEIQAYGRYLQNIYECITKYADFDILGHYDYIVRYAPYKKKVILYEDFSEIIDQILIFLAKEGKALEVNSNTYRDKYGKAPYLDQAILKRYKELGGESVSMGSDAHDLYRIGEKFPEFSELIKSCGFKYVTHFKGREKVFVKID